MLSVKIEKIEINCDFGLSDSLFLDRVLRIANLKLVTVGKKYVIGFLRLIT